jgi:hypothetical protein
VKLAGIVLLLVAMYSLISCAVSSELVHQSVPTASALQPTGTPVPDATGTARVQQTQTAMPVASMFARLDSTAYARATVLALTRTSAPTPIHTPKPTAIPNCPPISCILEAFPLEIGTTWVYSVTSVSSSWYGEREDPKLGETRSTGWITETIIGKEQAGNTLVFTATLSRTAVETMRPWGEITGTVIHSATQRYRYERSYKVADYSVFLDGLEILRLPLEVGQEWFPFGEGWEGLLEDAAPGWYVWRVQEKRDLITQAGVFQGCFYLVLWTAPDHSLNWFCPGVGFVYTESHHHGTVGDQYWELQEMRRPQP